MERNKIILIVILALIVVLYVFFVVWGATSDDNKGNDKTVPKKTPVNGDNYKPNPGTKKAGNIMGDWLGRFLPKSGIPCSITAAEGSDLTCEAIAIGETKIKDKKGTTFRIATLVWKKGEARVEYDDAADVTGSDRMDDEQNFNLPDDAHDNAKQGTIIIFEEGGKLIISCRNNTQCQVGLK